MFVVRQTLDCIDLIMQSQIEIKNLFEILTKSICNCDMCVRSNAGEPFGRTTRRMSNDLDILPANVNAF